MGIEARGSLPDHRITDLFRLPGFMRLLWVRWPSQAGDGAFQLGAAALLLFTLDPTEATTAGEIAWIVTVTTLPFSIVGPFAGVVIDRWRRQRILAWSNVIRIAVIVVALPLASVTGWGQPLFLAAVVVVLSTNRFFLATLGAVLPKVVPGEALTPANAVATIGGSLAALGAAAGGGYLAGLVGEDRGGPEIVVVISAVLLMVSVVAAARLPAEVLGPDLVERPPPLRRELRRAADELVDGIRRILRARRAWAPIVTLSILRLVTATASIAALLVFRNLYGAGPTQVGIILTLFGIGAGLGAAVVTVADRRYGLAPETALQASLLVGGIAAVVFAPGLRPGALYAVNLVLGVAFALAKIPGDALVQSALADRFRGRVFAAYDVLYNLGWLLGSVAAAGFLPDARAAEGVLVGCGLVTLAVWAVARRWLRRMPPPVDVETWEEAEHVLDASSRGAR